MEVQLIDSTRNIKTQEEAKRIVQNHARICYSEKNWNELLDEAFQPGLMGNLQGCGHHSPFDHPTLSFYFDGPEKSLAMIFNNQGMYTTSEKSARYTVMQEIPEQQKALYDKWSNWFLKEIGERFPGDKFSKLYFKKKEADKTLAEKLAQENARYMTSVFTPTKMTHTLTWEQTNIIYHHFQDFIANNENNSEEFRERLAKTMKGFTEAPAIKNWIIDEAQVRMKGHIPLRFFLHKVEEHFGEDVYSTNYPASFASLAQLHRHRLAVYTVSGGTKEEAPLGFYLPRLVEAAGIQDEWFNDLSSVAEKDFPQAQLLCVGERGMREHMPAKTEERECGLAQLETTRVIDSFLKRYSETVPEIEKLRVPACSQNGCKKGGCTFGPEKYLERLI